MSLLASRTATGDGLGGSLALDALGTRRGLGRLVIVGELAIVRGDQWWGLFLGRHVENWGFCWGLTAGRGRNRGGGRGLGSRLDFAIRMKGHEQGGESNEER